MHFEVCQFPAQLVRLGIGNRDLRPQFGDRADDLTECARFDRLAQLFEGLFAQANFRELKRNLPVQAEQVGEVDLPVRPVLLLRLPFGADEAAGVTPPGEVGKHRPKTWRVGLIERSPAFVKRQTEQAMPEEGLPVGIGDAEPLGGLVELLRYVFPLFTASQQEDLGRFRAAALDRELFAPDAESALERVIDKLWHPQERILLAVRAVEEMNDFDQAGLARAVARLLFRGRRALVRKEDV